MGEKSWRYASSQVDPTPRAFVPRPSNRVGLTTRACSITPRPGGAESHGSGGTPQMCWISLSGIGTGIEPNTFDHPAVPAESFAGLDAGPGDPGGDAASAQVAADPRVVVALVGVQFDRSPARMAAADALDRRHQVQDRLEHMLSCRLAPETAMFSDS